MPEHAEPRNLLLSRLKAVDRALLEPHLERVDLPLRKLLEPRSKPIDHAYFLEDGIASVVANGAVRLPFTDRMCAELPWRATYVGRERS